VRLRERGLGVASVEYFAAGRGEQEKTSAELKGEFALDVVPTNHYGVVMLRGFTLARGHHTHRGGRVRGGFD
jgi:hypothetical protein